MVRDSWESCNCAMAGSPNTKGIRNHCTAPSHTKTAANSIPAPSHTKNGRNLSGAAVFIQEGSAYFLLDLYL